MKGALYTNSRECVPQLSWKRPPRRAAPRVQVARFVTSSFHYSPPSSSAEALPEVLPCTVTLMTSFLPSPETAMHPSKRRPGTGTSSRRVRRTQGHSPTGRLTVNMRNPYSPSTHGTRTSEAYFVRKNDRRTPFKPFSGGGGRFSSPEWFLKTTRTTATITGTFRRGAQDLVPRKPMWERRKPEGATQGHWRRAARSP